MEGEGFVSWVQRGFFDGSSVWTIELGVGIGCGAILGLLWIWVWFWEVGGVAVLLAEFWFVE